MKKLLLLSTLLVLVLSSCANKDAYEEINTRNFNFTHTQYSGCFDVDFPLDRDGNPNISTGIQYGKLSIGSKDPRFDIENYEYVEILYSADIIGSQGSEYFINSDSHPLYIDPYDFDREIELFEIEDIRCEQDPKFTIYEIRGYFPQKR